MKEKILAMVMAVTLCVTCVCGVLPTASAYSDVPDTELKEAVAVLTGLGIVDGYSDGNFHPAETLTRAQFCKLIVMAQGKGDKIGTGSSKTLFSDLPATHWAAGYLNLAYGDGLISGYGDGTIGPDDGVTLGQAVTIVLRTLGYTTADIGPFWPEDYLSKAAQLALTDGSSGSGDAVMTRGEAARLIYAMLRTENTAGKTFGETLGTTLLSSAVVLDGNATGTDGSQGMAEVYANGTVGYYEQVGTMPEELIGRRGTLLLNRNGKVMGLLPDDRAGQTISLAETSAKGITALDGSFYSITSGTTVVLKGEKATYQTAWYAMGNLSSAVLYYNGAGAVDLIWAGTASSSQSAYVVTVSSGAEAVLRSVFSVTGAVSVRKNGAAAEFADIAQYNVVTYDTATRTLLVSDRKITGHYENASPNVENPDTIQVLGAQFDVLDCAHSTLGHFRVGDKLTLLLTTDGDVAAAYPTGTVQGENIGIYDGSTVTLADGTRLSGVISGGDSLYGAVVKVSSSAIGAFSIYRAGGVSLSGPLNVETGMLGKYALAPGAAIYDQVNGGAAVQMTVKDLNMASVSAGKISSAILDGSGSIAILLLDDATGNCYSYGTLSTKTVSGGNTKEGTDYSYQTVAVTNSAGTGAYYSSTGANGSVGGLAVSTTGRSAAVTTLTKLKVSRSDLVQSGVGGDYVTAGGAVWPVDDQVQVYNVQTQQWITLEQALAFTDTFSVYYDRPVDAGGQIRVIYAE